ncbi:uncharacterized protein RAG0_08122 [Rhynchosporium agropyri]|uniref:Uncharacterized protein n=1 Tax=Rhynchosporium agropyri TaxID=914238 RepID=A0A1E1KP94_9HELO|nr:uncharacterized protein RAG0_08122 [Rhynchosporium agropyri]
MSDMTHESQAMAHITCLLVSAAFPTILHTYVAMLRDMVDRFLTTCRRAVTGVSLYPNAATGPLIGSRFTMEDAEHRSRDDKRKST